MFIHKIKIVNSRNIDVCRVYVVSGNSIWPRFILLLLYTAALLSFYSCSDEDEDIEPDYYLTEPLCKDTFTPKPYTYSVVGFYPSWKHDILPISSIKWDKITRVVYAFASPNLDGSLNVSYLTKMDELVSAAHAQGVEVYFSIGGAEDSDNFPIIATNEKTRSKFIKAVRHYIFAHCLDGVDIDWEVWTGAQSNTIVTEESSALITILKELQTELTPFNRKVSIDLYASDWGGKHYFDDVCIYADYLQVMAYDFSGWWTGPGPHSSYEDAIGSGSDEGSTGLAYWVNYRGWPKEKILLGVPFYGRDFDDNGKGISYRTIVSQFPEAPEYDQINNIYYNGKETIRRKATYIVENQFSGIMMWELAHDAPGDSISLLNVIDEVINP